MHPGPGSAPCPAPVAHARTPHPAAVAKQNAESHPALLTKGFTQRGEKVEKKRRDDPVAMAEITRLDDQAPHPARSSALHCPQASPDGPSARASRARANWTVAAGADCRAAQEARPAA